LLRNWYLHYSAEAWRRALRQVNPEDYYGFYCAWAETHADANGAHTLPKMVPATILMALLIKGRTKGRT